MKRILINATQPEELRVAIVDGQKLYDLDIEVPSRTRIKANIYRGRITRIEPSLEAAFVDFGGARHGFLPLKEVARSDFVTDPGETKVQIKDVLRQGQDLTVQVEKEERGSKGAALTTSVSLAGRYLVLMANNPRAGGVSRRINGRDRDDLRDAMSELNIPRGMGAIARTAGVGRASEELQADLDYLVALWKAIQKAADTRKAPFLIHRESNVIIRALRDYLRNDIGEVIIDDGETYQQARDFMQQVMPQSIGKLRRYDGSIPLFSRYQVESQIETAFRRSVELPSGGSVIIDHTEALTSIDINSARATGGADIEETALNTNREAAEEIARQFRLRDLGGLIVVDFIDMGPNRNQRQVENQMREIVKMDRARVQVGRISRFGLLELSRQRLRPSLGEYSHITCPRCGGEGSIRNVESLGLSVLRLVEEESMKEKTGMILVRLPPLVASFLLNEKRSTIAALEANFKVSITLIPSPGMETPDYELKRIREDEFTETEASHNSYELIETETHETQDEFEGYQHHAPAPEPAVKNLPPRTPVPGRSRATKVPTAEGKKEGGLHRFWNALRAFFSPPEEPPAREKGRQRTSADRQRSPGSGSVAKAPDQSRRPVKGGNSGSRQKSSAPAGPGKAAPAQESEHKNQQRVDRRRPKSAPQQGGSDGTASDQQPQPRKRGGRRSRGRRGGRNRSRNIQSNPPVTGKQPQNASRESQQSAQSGNTEAKSASSNERGDINPTVNKPTGSTKNRRRSTPAEHIDRASKNRSTEDRESKQSATAESETETG